MAPLLSFHLYSAPLARALRLASLAGLLALAGCQSLQQSSDPVDQATPETLPTNTVAQPTAATVQAPPADIWARMRAGFSFSIEDNAQIVRHRQLFIDNPRTLEAASERGSLYMHYIVERLEERQLPLELALLPVIESAYNPLAYSRAHAAGLWQFIPATGRHFNLRQTNWYDGRRDVTASTDAALNYLTRLHAMFDGDWPLALAAYNAGEGTVRRAIKRNESKGLPTDFWSLPLPRETRDYVPKLLGLASLVKAPEQYNVALNPIPNEPYFEVVEIDRRMDLARAAKLAELDEQHLYLLNPAFKRRITMDGPRHLLVPSSNADILTANLAQLPQEDLVDWREYKVRPGDSLYTIARQHNLTVGMLQEINRIKGTHLRIGQLLSIPSHAGQPAPAARTVLASASPAGEGAYNYRVKNGDSLWTIAANHKVSVTDIKRWNKLSGNRLRIDQVLTLRGGNAQPAGEQPTLYKVRKGDSLYAIAKRFNVNVSHLQNWNPNSSAALRPGQTLTLYLAD